jgi:beta-glucuronidase
MIQQTAWFVAILAASIVHCNAQTPQIQNIENRKTTTLNGKWNYIVDQYETGYYNYRYEPIDQTPDYENNTNAFFYDKPAKESDLIEFSFEKSETLLVPRSWNIQNDKLFYYEGTIWYQKKFDYNKTNPANKVFVYFGAVNYQADVYLNGQKLGQHIGGFTPFNFEISSLLKEKDNSLVVKVDNKRRRDGVPTLNTDWFNYGGITRDVLLVETPSTFINQYGLQLQKGSMNKVKGFVNLSGEDFQNKTVTISIPELKFSRKFQTNTNGWTSVEFELKNLKLWSPESPKLYDVTISTDANEVKDRIGFRSIETRGNDILLNGKSIFLRGICIHEENGTRGDRAYSREDATMLLNRAKELNCNFVRLAHYPHNENMIRVAEEMGIMVWEEIPVYWTILWDNPETFENAQNQLFEVITRDRNRANVIIWSMANETPLSEPRYNFLSKLISFCRQMDSTRLISAALEKHAMPDNPLVLTVNDPMVQLVDVLSFNEYVGWYDGLPEKCQRVSWKIDINKPVIISEFGGDALQGLHGSKDQRWTEEFQEDLYIKSLDMLSKIPSLRGVNPWILNDFRSPRRTLPKIQDGWNRKGLFSETGDKKKAFYVLRNFYLKKQEEYK